MASKVFDSSKINIDPVTGLIRVDCIIIGKKVVREGQVYLQFKDGDSVRSRCRNANLVEILLEDFVRVIQGGELLL